MSDKTLQDFMEPLMAECNEHERKHRTGAQISRDECMKILKTLKNFLPMICKAFVSPSASSSDIQGTCNFIELLLHRKFCVYSKAVFTSGDVSQVGLPLLLLFHILAFKSHKDAHPRVIQTIVMLLSFLESQNTSQFGILFGEILQLLQDILVLDHIQAKGPLGPYQLSAFVETSSLINQQKCSDSQEAECELLILSIQDKEMLRNIQLGTSRTVEQVLFRSSKSLPSSSVLERLWSIMTAQLKSISASLVNEPFLFEDAAQSSRLYDVITSSLQSCAYLLEKFGEFSRPHLIDYTSSLLHLWDSFMRNLGSEGESISFTTKAETVQDVLMKSVRAVVGSTEFPEVLTVLRKEITFFAISCLRKCLAPKSLPHAKTLEVGSLDMSRFSLWILFRVLEGHEVEALEVGPVLHALRSAEDYWQLQPSVLRCYYTFFRGFGQAFLPMLKACCISLSGIRDGCDKQLSTAKRKASELERNTRADRGRTPADGSSRTKKLSRQDFNGSQEGNHHLAEQTELGESEPECIGRTTLAFDELFVEEVSCLDDPVVLHGGHSVMRHFLHRTYSFFFSGNWLQQYDKATLLSFTTAMQVLLFSINRAYDSEGVETLDHIFAPPFLDRFWSFWKTWLQKFVMQSVIDKDLVALHLNLNLGLAYMQMINPLRVLHAAIPDLQLVNDIDESILLHLMEGSSDGCTWKEEKGRGRISGESGSFLRHGELLELQELRALEKFGLLFARLGPLSQEGSEPKRSPSFSAALRERVKAGFSEIKSYHAAGWPNEALRLLRRFPVLELYLWLLLSDSESTEWKKVVLSWTSALYEKLVLSVGIPQLRIVTLVWMSSLKGLLSTDELGLCAIKHLNYCLGLLYEAVKKEITTSSPGCALSLAFSTRGPQLGYAFHQMENPNFLTYDEIEWPDDVFSFLCSFINPIFDPSTASNIRGEFIKGMVFMLQHSAAVTLRNHRTEVHGFVERMFRQLVEGDGLVRDITADRAAFLVCNGAKVAQAIFTPHGLNLSDQTGFQDPEALSLSHVLQSLCRMFTDLLKESTEQMEADEAWTLIIGSYLRAIGSVGSHLQGGSEWVFCYMWAIAVLVERWAHQTLYNTFAFEELFYMCRTGRTPLATLMAEQPVETHPRLLKSLLQQNRFRDFLTQVFTIGNMAGFLNDGLPFVLPAFMVEQDADALSELERLVTRYTDVHGLQELLWRYIDRLIPRIFLENSGAMEFFLSYMPNCNFRMIASRYDQAIFSSLLTEMAEVRHDPEKMSLAKMAMAAIAKFSKHSEKRRQDESTLKEGTRDSSAEEVESFVAGHFLYVISKTILPSNWKGRTVEEKVQAMSSLEILIELVSCEKLIPFIPKVLSVIIITLSERNLPDVEEAACRTLLTFIQRLNDVSLAENLSVIVVGVLPVLTEDNRSTKNPNPLPEAKPARRLILHLLHTLIVKKRNSLRGAFKTIPFLPCLPELREVLQVFNEEVGATSLREQLRRLLPLLDHDSPQVKLASLRQLATVFQHDPEGLYGLIGGGNESERLIVDLMKVLLGLSLKEADQEVKIACSVCLGEIGAIDPARLDIKVQGHKPQPPWQVNDSLLALTLVETMLVPSLRAATQDQDRVPFAIQELLRLLYKRGPEPLGETGQVVDEGSTQIEEETGDREESKEPLPEWLKRQLEEREVLEVVEPFWDTEYVTVTHKKDQAEPPVLRLNISFERRLVYFVRSFSERSKGPLRELFCACRGVVRLSGMHSFLFPYLVADAWCFGDTSDKELLMLEILSVLSKTDLMEENRPLNESDHVAVQALLSLLDTLSDWASQGKAVASKDEEGSRLWQDSRDLLREFLDRIPSLVLVEASLRIRAFTRALKYCEKKVRRCYFDRGLPVITEGDVTDGANNAVPPLEEEDLLVLQRIYSHLDEPDGMAGLDIRWRSLKSRPSLKRIISQCEHEENWYGALQGYEQGLQERKCGEGIDDFSGGELEEGLMRSMLEMGHLDSLLSQHAGLVANDPDLKKPLARYAVEASWRLGRWQVLEEMLACEEASTALEGMAESNRIDAKFQYLVGEALLCLYKENDKAFETMMRMGRLELMGSLSAASMESYQRAYPSLLKLHILHEIEQGHELMRLKSDVGDSENKEFGARKMLETWKWEERLGAMTTSIRCRESVMAVRRTILQFCSLKNLTGECWLELARAARLSGRFYLAEAALRHAQCLGLEVSMEEGRLLHAQGKIYQALLHLEPIDIDIAETKEQLAQLVIAGGHIGNDGFCKETAERLVLTTNWMVEAGIRQGQPVLDRFKLALELRPKWEQGLFSLAKYYDFLLLARRQENIKNSGGNKELDAKKSREDEVLHSYILSAMEFYAQSIQYGCRYIFQSMPRLLTLWSEIGSLYDDQASPVSIPLRSGRASGTYKNAAVGVSMDKLQEHADLFLKRAVSNVPAYLWYTCLPQLLSRVGHSKGEMLNRVMDAINKVLCEFPEQSMWSITGLLYSKDAVRKKVGGAILQDARTHFARENKREKADLLLEGKKLFQDLIELANNQDDNMDRRIKHAVGKRLMLDKILVPLQAALTVSLPQKASQEFSSGSCSPESSDGGGAEANHEPFPSSQMRMAKFHERVEILHSKAKPKKVTIRTQCGQDVKFLCKQEKNGDLRKDARLMEFNGMINRLLQQAPEGRRRKLRLRTYAVICLNEECGLLEWVPNTIGLRFICTEAYKYDKAKIPGFRDLKDIMENLQTSHRDDIPAMARNYRKEILATMPPRLHRWFLEVYPEPTSWFEARTTFSRSAAVWSCVGHIVGLGDRHGENILIDMRSGECVHVDFDCLFDKGLGLARPEVVPFRLTPNMVDGMGLTGYEGVFRGVMEITLGTLRGNRETLLSVLDPFLRDPTVSWDKQGKAQRGDFTNDGGKGAAGGGARRDEHDHDAPSHALAVIDERLHGMYNLKRLLRKGAVEKKRRGAGGSRVGDNSSPMVSAKGAPEVCLPLSVQGQVHRLIQEATSIQNLCQMYVGWMPWF